MIVCELLKKMTEEDTMDRILSRHILGQKDINGVIWFEEIHLLKYGLYFTPAICILESEWIYLLMMKIFILYFDRKY
jgi:hypothetical protein